MAKKKTEIIAGILVVLLITGWIIADTDKEIVLTPPIGHSIEKDTSRIVLLNAHKCAIQARKAVVENLTNAKSIGYKRNLVHFIDSSTVSIKRDFSQGELKLTNRPLDIAISGKGFFAVTDKNGKTYYTRRGDLMINPDGQLYLTKGYPLEPMITVPADSLSITVAKDGDVLCQSSDGSAVVVGEIQLYCFINEQGLSYQGSGLYSQTELSGSPIVASPGSEGAGSISSEYLESSNVNDIEEMIILEELNTFQNQIQRAVELVKSND